MKTVPTLIKVTLVALVFMTLPAVATQVLYQTIEELGSKSAVVVQGEVASVRSYWNDAHTKIFTETTIAVDSAYKGDASQVVQVLQLGGTVGNVRVTAHGALQWTPGEEVVLFLEPYRDGKFQVAGFSQGKFNVVRDPQTSEVFVMRSALEGIQLVAVPENADESTGLLKLPLDRFIYRALGEIPARHED
jgi:hypothetical protein